MARTMNRATIIGFLGADPEVRRMQSGEPVVSFSLATKESWKDKQGEWKDRTEWHHIVIYNKHLCSVAEKYLVKGSHVYVEGPIQTRSWTDKDGLEHSRTEIVLQPYNGTLNILDANSSEDDDNGQE